MKRSAWLVILMWGMLGGSGACAWAGDQDPPPPAFTNATIIHFDGPITHIQQHYVFRKLDDALRSGANLIILEINSPGGYVDASFAIANRLRNLTDARTVAYIPENALSGAAFVALGCDEIVMHPQAMLGDAGPVILGEDSAFRHAPEKIVSDLAARVRTLAEARGRPAVLAEAMVDMNLVVMRVTDEQGGVFFVSQEEYQKNPGKWKTAEEVPESKKGRFLEVTGIRGEELGLADALVRNRAELLERYQLAPPIREVKFGAVETTVAVLNNPWITGLLLVVGMIALFVEFSAPGISIGGLISGLCVALFFWSRFLGGTSGWLEVVLFLAGVVFLAVEVFVLPGFGVSGIAGILLMLTAVVMAGQDFVVPHGGAQWKVFTTSLLIVFGSMVGVAIGLVAVSRYFGKVPILGNMVLEPPRAADAAAAASLDSSGKPLAPSPDDAKFALRVGDWGVSDSPLRPAGKAVFGDQYLDVVTDGSFVEPGRQVRVIQIRGNRIVVREVT